MIILMESTKCLLLLTPPLTHAHTHTHMHTQTHTHTHTHTHYTFYTCITHIQNMHTSTHTHTS